MTANENASKGPVASSSLVSTFGLKLVPDYLCGRPTSPPDHLALIGFRPRLTPPTTFSFQKQRALIGSHV